MFRNVDDVSITLKTWLIKVIHKTKQLLYLDCVWIMECKGLKMTDLLSSNSTADPFFVDRNRSITITKSITPFVRGAKKCRIYRFVVSHEMFR